VFVFTVLVVTVVAMTPNSVIIPGLPAIAAGLGVSRAVVGMLITVYTASSGISSLFVGMLADRAGRKMVLIPSLLMYAAGGTVPLYSGAMGVVLAGRVVQGIGGSGLMSSIYGLIGDFYEDAPDRNRLLGLVNGTIAISEMAVPLVGGALAAMSWKTPFAAYALAVPAAVLCAVTLPRAGRFGGPATDYARGLAATLSSPTILGTFLAKLGFTMAYFMLLTCYPFAVVSRLKGSSVLAGMMLIPMGVMWSVSAFSMPRLTARFSTRRLAVIGGAAQAVSAAGMAFAWTTPVMAAMFGIWGFGAGLSNPSLLSIMIESSGESCRGAVSSLFSCVALVGGSIGPAVSGYLALPSGDLAPAFLFACGILLAGTLGFARLVRPLPDRGSPPPGDGMAGDSQSEGSEDCHDDPRDHDPRRYRRD
jgi:MFS family permease